MPQKQLVSITVCGGDEIPNEWQGNKEVYMVIKRTAQVAIYLDGVLSNHCYNFKNAIKLSSYCSFMCPEGVVHAALSLRWSVK